MKKTLILVVVILMLAVMVAGTAFADPGGAPGAHGVDGKDFGKAVSALAQSEPGAVAAHVTGK